MQTLARQPLKTLKAEFRLRRAAASRTNETVLISRQASPLSNGHIERELLSKAARGVYDFDDALGTIQRTSSRSAWSKQRVWMQSVSAADVVIAGNTYLADQASQHSQNVVVIPSCVDPGDYTTKADYSIAGAPRAMWIGSPSTEQYLSTISEALLTVHQSTGLRLTVISAGNSSLGPLDVMVDRKNWTRSTFGEDVSHADFGIMPLIDDEWTRGKCAYKLLQYGAAGLPVFGSPIGANAEVLARAGAGGPTSTEEWVFELESLIHESSAARAEKGSRARQTVVAHYSFAAWAAKWAESVGYAQ
ncbi:hypothetical protein AB0O95_01390 [Rhodoglobus sp. NPDC076762]